MDKFDVVVIGAGPAGVSGAHAAAVMGARTLLVECESSIGGAGINTGTVPSKTLRETAIALSGLRSRKLHGVDLSLRRDTSITEFTHHRDNVVRGERSRIEARLDSLGVERMTGVASFLDPHRLSVRAPDGHQRIVAAERILVATGSSPHRPPGFDFGHTRIHDSNEILEMEELPRVLGIVGAGVIGCEYASTFAALGCEVHLIDGRDGLLPFLDTEISAALTTAMQELGVRLHLGEHVEHCRADAVDDSVSLVLRSGPVLDCDDVLVCAGRTSNTLALRLERAGVEVQARGLIEVDSNFTTSVAHIYAAGDVIGAPALAATGMEQARAAISRALGSDLKNDLAALLPTGVYTIPEIGAVGETEQSLRAAGTDYVVGRWRMADTPRGCILGDEHGMMKLLFRKSDMRVLGVHVIGEQATETIHVGMIAMLANADAHLFSRACFNYPTLGDLYKYATYDALLKCRAEIPPHH
jgi:NAD(P) transhydrogenase